jgi:hypothetical protein
VLDGDDTAPRQQLAVDLAGVDHLDELGQPNVAAYHHGAEIVDAS